MFQNPGVHGLKISGPRGACLHFYDHMSIVCVSRTSHLSHEALLLSELLSRTNTLGQRLARPVHDVHDALLVHYGLSLIQILDVDEINQNIIINVWENHVSLLLVFNGESQNIYWTLSKTTRTAQKKSPISVNVSISLELNRWCILPLNVGLYNSKTEVAGNLNSVGMSTKVS